MQVSTFSNFWDVLDMWVDKLQVYPRLWRLLRHVLLKFCFLGWWIFRWGPWLLHGFVSWSTGQPCNAGGNDWQTAAYISSKADGAKELEFSQSVCCYGFNILSCRVCCWEGLMDSRNENVFILSIWGSCFFLPSGSLISFFRHGRSTTQQILLLLDVLLEVQYQQKVNAFVFLNLYFTNEGHTHNTAWRDMYRRQTWKPYTLNKHTEKFQLAFYMLDLLLDALWGSALAFVWFCSNLASLCSWWLTK